MQQTSRAVRDANSNDTRTTGDNGLGSLGRAVWNGNFRLDQAKRNHARQPKGADRESVFGEGE